jgi:AI-2 transport system permease protein
MNWNRILRSRELAVFGILLILMILIGIINPVFLEGSSIKNMVDSSLILIVIGIGEMFVLLTRGVDVSVGASMGLSAVILGLSLKANMPIPVCILLTVLTGLLAGMLNGFGVTVLNVPPIIMTLGTLGLYRGVMPLLTGGSWIETVPKAYKLIAGMSVGLASVLSIVVFLLAVLAALLLKQIKSARWFFAVGDNEQGAYMMGIPVKLVRFIAYSLAGLFASVGAIIFVAQIGFIPMATGDGLEMRAIAADVLGGISLAGGVGSPLAAIVGGLFLTVIDSVIVYLKIPAEWNNAIAGAMLLAVLLLDYRIRLGVETRQRLARVRGRTAHSSISMPSTKPNIAEGD